MWHGKWKLYFYLSGKHVILISIFELFFTYKIELILLKFRILVFLLILQYGVQAQQNRFIYIQTENKTGFYVIINKLFLRSSSAGYIIIPRLKDSTYILTIGSPQNNWPEQNVSISTKLASAGFLLKKQVDKGWSLQNLQSQQVLKPGKQSEPVVETEVITNTDDFARILAEVVNDPSIAKVTIEKKATEETTSKKDTDNEKTPVANKEIKTVDISSQIINPGFQKTEISKLRIDSTAEGLNITYLDKVNANADTVKIFIPNNNPDLKTKTEIQKENIAEVPKTASQKKPDTRFIDMELQNPNVKTDSSFSKAEDFVITEKKSKGNEIPKLQLDSVMVKSSVKEKMINSDCKRMATQNEFLKLRKQMAGTDEEGIMTKMAIKSFTSICFTTEQIKNLGVLYNKEEERYKFYVAAYPFVSDSQNFSILSDQLTDNYYITRFKAMLIH